MALEEAKVVERDWAGPGDFRHHSGDHRLIQAGSDLGIQINEAHVALCHGPASEVACVQTANAAEEVGIETVPTLFTIRNHIQAELLLVSDS